MIAYLGRGVLIMSDRARSKGKFRVVMVTIIRKTAQGDMLVWAGSLAEARKTIKSNTKHKQITPQRWLKMLDDDGVFCESNS